MLATVQQALRDNQLFQRSTDSGVVIGCAEYRGPIKWRMTGPAPEFGEESRSVPSPPMAGEEAAADNPSTPEDDEAPAGTDKAPAVGTPADYMFADAKQWDSGIRCHVGLRFPF